MPREHRTEGELPPIATLLTPAERPRVDAAGEGCYQTLHRESIEDLIRDLKSRQVHAVLVSVSCAGPQVPRVASLVREFPRVPAVALLSEFELKTPQAVLALGQCGIRRLVDVRNAAGWRELRGALMADTGDRAQRVFLSQLALDLQGAPPDCCRFFEARGERGNYAAIRRIPSRCEVLNSRSTDDTSGPGRAFSLWTTPTS